jgi:O-antigen ligase
MIFAFQELSAASPSLPKKPVLLRLIYWLVVVSVAGLTFSIALSSIAMGTAIVLWLAHLVMTRGATLRPNRMDLFFLFYVIAELLSSIFALDPTASFFNMKRMFLITFVYLVLATMDTERKLKVALGFFVGVTALLSLFEMFSLTSIGGHYMRLSLFQYYMTEGGIKMIALLLLVPFLIHPSTPKKVRNLGLLCALPLLTGLILTQTRSSWLGFAAGVVSVGMIRGKKTILALVLLIAVFLVVAPRDYRARAASIFDPTDRSNLSRIHMITTGWRMYLDHPLLGIGDTDLKKLYVTYITPIEEGEGGHLHNNLMTLLVTLGTVGIIATGAMFVRVFQIELDAVRRTKDNWFLGSISLGCFATYVGFHVNGLFEWNFGDHEIAVLLWFTVGMAMVAQRFFLESNHHLP